METVAIECKLVFFDVFPDDVFTIAVAEFAAIREKRVINRIPDDFMEVILQRTQLVFG